MDVQAVEGSGAVQPAQPPEGAAPPEHAAKAPDQQPSTPGAAPRPLSSTLAGLFGSPEHHADAVRISYRSGGPNEIVTVFTDASGKEIAQLPSRLLIDMATFFDHHSGVTLDRSA